MKKLTLGIAIGIALSIGGIAVASSTVRLIPVPEYVGGFSTIDLLNYLAELKAKSLVKPVPAEIVPSVNKGTLKASA